MCLAASFPNPAASSAMAVPAVQRGRHLYLWRRQHQIPLSDFDYGDDGDDDDSAVSITGGCCGGGTCTGCCFAGNGGGEPPTTAATTTRTGGARTAAATTTARGRQRVVTRHDYQDRSCEPRPRNWGERVPAASALSGNGPSFPARLYEVRSWSSSQ